MKWWALVYSEQEPPAHNMFLLMSNEYSRIYEDEKKKHEQIAYPPKEKANFFHKYVTRGLRLKKEKLAAEKQTELFKMKK